ncbi:nuclear transport factor 2 family protein [Brevibacillus daliensis]|uniref:nuclear transport factor 2 family protein n=1 Tax=Brevibacillus daliensis TaxID=2892995 RepID=UPI001E60AB53|nr:DUF4440 domain-containing protein [Brevibacillus daliensis]
MERESLQAQILEFELRLQNPDIRQSLEEFIDLLADDFFEVGSYGDIWYKKDCENGLTPFKMTLLDFQLHSLSTDCVLATYRLIDETREINTMRSSIWRHRDGKWQMFYHQSTIKNNRSQS